MSNVKLTSDLPALNDGLALNYLCEAMFIEYNNYVKEHFCEPKLRVDFSSDGYYKVRACADSMKLFSHPCADIGTVNGYPFSIDRGQKEDFIIRMDNA
jgi:hypothetical protein